MNVSQHHRNTINKMDLEELQALNEAVVGRIKWLRSEEAARMKRRLCFGCEVQFEDNDGKVVKGYVLKTMRKYAQVEVGKQTWRVPMHRLSRTSTQLGA